MLLSFLQNLLIDLKVGFVLTVKFCIGSIPSVKEDILGCPETCPKSIIVLTGGAWRFLPLIHHVPILQRRRAPIRGILKCFSSGNQVFFNLFGFRIASV